RRGGEVSCLFWDFLWSAAMLRRLGFSLDWWRSQEMTTESDGSPEAKPKRETQSGEASPHSKENPQTDNLLAGANNESTACEPRIQTTESHLGKARNRPRPHGGGRRPVARKLVHARRTRTIAASARCRAPAVRPRRL